MIKENKVVALALLFELFHLDTIKDLGIKVRHNPAEVHKEPVAQFDDLFILFFIVIVFHKMEKRPHLWAGANVIRN